MPGTWIPCPASWKLEYVQAGLNVLVTILSFLVSYVFVQSCWQRSAKQAAKGIGLPLHSLLSISTLGEVWDVAFLLRRNLLNRRYLKIWAQCFIVIFFSGTAILSGPIVSYSSKTMVVPRVGQVPGLLASNFTFDSMSRTIDWNNTYNMLERARFPRDQLLDFLPSNEVDWMYKADQWNNSWTMDCEYTPNASAVLLATGNCTNYWSELQGLDTVVSASQYFDSEPALQSEYVGSATMLDGLLVIYGASQPDIGADGSADFNIVIALLHLHGVSMTTDSTNTTGCTFGRGAIESALYSRAECKLSRSVRARATNYHAHPILRPGSTYLVSKAFIDHLYGRFEREIWGNSTVTIVSPEDLVRIYQVYMAVKDTMIQLPVTWELDVNTLTVYLSPIFIAVASVTAALVLLGVLNIAVFTIRSWSQTPNPPQSRVDWMLQSIEAEDRPLYMRDAGMRKCVTVDSVADLQAMSHPQRQKLEFEGATYGVRGTTTWFHKNPVASFSSYDRHEISQDATKSGFRLPKLWSKGGNAASN